MNMKNRERSNTVKSALQFRNSGQDKVSLGTVGKAPGLFTNTAEKVPKSSAFKSDNRLSDSWKELEENICWNKWNVPWLLWSKFLGLS